MHAAWGIKISAHVAPADASEDGQRCAPENEQRQHDHDRAKGQCIRRLFNNNKKEGKNKTVQRQEERNGRDGYRAHVWCTREREKRGRGEEVREKVCVRACVRACVRVGQQTGRGEKKKQQKKPRDITPNNNKTTQSPLPRLPTRSNSPR